MPSLGRGDFLTGNAWLSTSGLGRPAQFGAMGRVAQSWIWGAEITATLQQYARVRLDIYWPDVRLATVTRYDADGTSSPVRNCEPLWLSTAAVVYDHEAPLDVACYYRVNPVGDTSVYWDSDPVTPTANAPWLKHVFKPYLSRQVHLRVMGQREQGARRGVARPIDRADPIVVHQTRTTDSGSLVIQTDGTWAENDAIRALLADGAPLLLQQGAALGEQQLYISVDSTRAELLDNEAGWMFRRDWTLPFDVITRPAGLASGPYGINYNAISAAYLTYEHVAAGEPTYADLAAAPGP